MSFGKMNTFIEILEPKKVKDKEGFTSTQEIIVASIRAYYEERHGTEVWKNRASFSNATCMFRFRHLQGLKITRKHIIVCEQCRFDIISVEDVKGKNMYIEVLAKRTEE